MFRCAGQRNVRPDIHNRSKDLRNLRTMLDHLMSQIKNKRKYYGMQNDRGVEVA
jgi:hypothetical protein